MTLVLAAVVIISRAASVSASEGETLPALKDGQPPRNFEQMWAGFDPQAEPLEVEVLKEWEEDGVVLRIVRFRIGIFKGTIAKLAAIYGFPKDAVQRGTKLPGLVQIHGGGQYADHKACLANAKRGYATVSIAWAGRISAPGYRVSPAEVKLFWEGKTDDPNYRLTTDWGAVDGYHAPGRNAGNQFPSAKSAAWTLDDVESPRNSGWFLCALAARRALTFLEQQPEVDPNRLGVYGHSMGGKLTVMTAVDPRVKAAAPSCGGISDRDNRSPLFRATLGDDVRLKQINCPIIFLSPANDFHGRIGDLPDSINEIASKDWRVTCSPHHNHQDTAEYEVATLLWFEQHLKGSFKIPRTPDTDLKLNTPDGVPAFTVKPDASKPVLSVDVFYTLQGKADERPEDREDTMHRFWHHAAATNNDGVWTASLPLSSTDKPLWVYANIRYPLGEPVSGAGYYYGSYTANTFNLSSLLMVITAEELASAGARATLKPSSLIEDFDGDWEKEWFTYRPAEWARTTHKLNAEIWKAPPGAKLVLELQAAERNKLVVLLDEYAAEVEIDGGDSSQEIVLGPNDFRNYSGEPLTNWNGVRRLKLTPAEHLRPGRGKDSAPRLVGANWKGTPPRFRTLRWGRSARLTKGPRRPGQQTRAQARRTSETKRPNIVFLFADDQRADTIGAHGNPHIQTPNLDQLAADGFSFRRNYCAGSFSGAVCVVSRTMLMTGRHWMNLPANKPASNWGDATVLPALLTTSGNYNSFIVGKWHNGRGTLDKSFTNGRSIYMGGMANHADFQVQDLTDGKLGPKRDAGGFSSTVFADEAVKFIQNAGSDHPFFLYVAFMAPHDPRNPPEKYRQMYYEKRPPLPANFLPQHPFKNAPQATSGRDESLAPWPRTKEVISDQLCEYYGLVTHLDEQVGRVLKALKESPHADNTIVVYTADHGLAMGSHGLLGKQNVYEQSMRCPLILRGPGIPSGKSSTALTYIHDLYSTICDFAGIKTPDGIDSQGLNSIMNGQVASIRESLFLPFQDNQRAVSNGKWKLHIYPKINHRLLFDLSNDPHELNNLAADPAHKADAERMQALMESWRKRLGDPSPLSVENPEPKKPQYDNSKRVLDVWQPKWIRDKYFDGRDNPNHGKRPAPPRRDPKKSMSIPG